MFTTSRLLTALYCGVGFLFLALVMPLPFASATDLPPRPTVAPTATPVAPMATPTTPAIGGVIQLRVNIPTARLWTAVQWQDGLGGWHTVAGWQGHFDQYGTVTWWVAPPDLATGPFRWQIFTEEGGQLAAVSSPFYLPESAGQVLLVRVDDRLDGR